jgi:hypothetical protein
MKRLNYIVLPISLACSFSLYSFATAKNLTSSNDLGVNDTTSKSDTINIKPADSSVNSSLSSKVTNISEASETSNVRDVYDRIVKFNGDTLYVKVLNSRDNQLSFHYPLNSVIEAIDKKKIKEVYYANGEEVVLQHTKADSSGAHDAASIINVDDWAQVTITNNSRFANNMISLGIIESEYIGEKFNTPAEVLEKNATIILQKKAARKKAVIVVLKNKNLNISYGELPSMQMRGEAFGFE